jgi:hypothetical protein
MNDLHRHDPFVLQRPEELAKVRTPDLAPVNRTVAGKRNEPKKGCGGGAMG